ncbi:Hypothetical protein A7982_01871 [Minicystis rosea]|nr:Hypothetical protein A7982_01871 [Minicystis rosea]
MEVKGTAFLARKAMLVQEIGETKAAEYLAAYAREDPTFEGILATTTIPIARFIAFNEALVRDFYGGDRTSYMRIGAASAEWALTVGPYKHIRASRSLAQFAESGRVLYANYFTGGRAETAIDGNVIDLRILGIVAPYRHVYFEYAIVGYFQRGLELVGARAVRQARIRGFSQGDADVHYRYTMA